MMSFWDNLQKPILGLAPMDGVTDIAYRIIQARYGKPDVMFTEFVPVEAIVRLNKNVLKGLLYTQEERPLVAQIYGKDPELFYASAQLVCELGFDGIDINMGCPVRAVVQRGCGAALIKTPDLAVEIIKTTQQAVKDWQENGIDWSKWPVVTGEIAEKNLQEFIKESKRFGIYSDLTFTNQSRKILPVSVKTRIGIDKPETEKWIIRLLKTKPAAISIHGRVLKQMSKGDVNWDELSKAVKLRDEQRSETLILANGDIKSAQDVSKRLKQANFDGFLIGRASFGNPWIFKELRKQGKRPGKKQIYKVMLEHTRLHEKYKPKKQFVQMRKALAWYIKTQPGAAKLRAKLVKTNNSRQVDSLLT
jgi:tRNA-dihydrouridine synthase